VLLRGCFATLRAGAAQTLSDEA
jgi:hypothetical protein